MSKKLFVTDWHMPDFDIESKRLEENGWSWSIPEMNRATPPKDQILNEVFERIESEGGRVSIDSAVGASTKLSAFVPVIP